MRICRLPKVNITHQKRSLRGKFPGLSSKCEKAIMLPERIVRGFPSYIMNSYRLAKYAKSIMGDDVPGTRQVLQINPTIPLCAFLIIDD